MPPATPGLHHRWAIVGIESPAKTEKAAAFEVVEDVANGGPQLRDGIRSQAVGGGQGAEAPQARIAQAVSAGSSCS